MCSPTHRILLAGFHYRATLIFALSFETFTLFLSTIIKCSFQHPSRCLASAVLSDRYPYPLAWQAKPRSPHERDEVNLYEPYFRRGESSLLAGEDEPSFVEAGEAVDSTYVPLSVCPRCALISASFSALFLIFFLLLPSPGGHRWQNPQEAPFRHPSDLP